MMRYTHCAPLERGYLDMSHSINMSILWIEERDSDQNVLLAERIIPTGIMACSQVTLHIALLWSADAGRDHVLLTSHSSGVKTRPRRNAFHG